jgi:hypothetical protein
MLVMTLHRNPQILLQLSDVRHLVPWGCFLQHLRNIIYYVPVLLFLTWQLHMCCLVLWYVMLPLVLQ